MSDESMEGPTRVVFCGEDAQQKLQDYLFEWEKRSLTRFRVRDEICKGQIKKHGKARAVASEGGRLYWEDHSITELPISFDGVPFIVIGHQLQECANGPDRHRAEKNKASEHKADHEYWERSRKLVQPTKKMNCPAAIHIRLVVRFPTYKLENDSDWSRRKMAKVLKTDLADSEREVSGNKEYT